MFSCVEILYEQAPTSGRCAARLTAGQKKQNRELRQNGGLLSQSGGRRRFRRPGSNPVCYVGGCRRQIRWCTNNVSVISSCSVFFFSSLRGPSGSPPGALRGPSRGALRGLCRGLFTCRRPLSMIMSNTSAFFKCFLSSLLKCSGSFLNTVWVPVACGESGFFPLCALQNATSPFLWGTLLTHPKPTFAQKTFEKEVKTPSHQFCFCRQTDRGFFAGRTV